MALWEVRQYGLDSYSDADYVSLYGMRPADWFQQGVRLLARTVVECTSRRAGRLHWQRCRADGEMRRFPRRNALFSIRSRGHAITLYWILRHLPGARGVAFEDDAK